MTALVIDAALVVSALVDTGRTGVWAESQLLTDSLVAPHLLPAEVANILRRAARAGRIPAEVASLAHNDLLALKVDLVAYEPFAERVWQLRDTTSAYDAWYVALAEALSVPLATLDARLARAPGTRCEFRLPPSA